MHIDPMSTDKGFDIDAYWQHGYQFPLRVMSTGEAQRYRDQLQAVEANPPVGTENPLRIYLRNNTHVVMPMAAELARNPCILDQVEKVLGANILCWSCEFFIKEAATDKIVTWHQDLTYWGLAAQNRRSPPGWPCHQRPWNPAVCALSAVRIKMRCCRIGIRFANPICSHVARKWPWRSMKMKRWTWCCNLVKCHLHHGRVFHASGPNTSADRRIGVAIRYVTPRFASRLPTAITLCWCAVLMNT